MLRTLDNKYILGNNCNYTLWVLSFIRSNKLMILNKHWINTNTKYYTHKPLILDGCAIQNLGLRDKSNEYPCAHGLFYNQWQTVILSKAISTQVRATSAEPANTLLFPLVALYLRWLLNSPLKCLLGTLCYAFLFLDRVGQPARYQNCCIFNLWNIYFSHFCEISPSKRENWLLNMVFYFYCMLNFTFDRKIMVCHKDIFCIVISFIILWQLTFDRKW